MAALHRRKVHIALGIGALIIVALVAFLLLRPEDASELPPAVREDLVTAEQAAEYTAELDRIAGQMAVEGTPDGIRQEGIQIAAIEDQSRVLLKSLKRSQNPLIDGPRQSVRGALRNVIRAAKALKFAGEALRLGRIKITEARDILASEEASSTLSKQAAISAAGQDKARKAGVHLERSRQALRRAKRAISKVADTREVDDEALRSRLSKLGRTSIPSNRDVKDLAARLAFQEERLSRLSSELKPKPAFSYCGEFVPQLAKDAPPVTVYGSPNQPCGSHIEVAQTYWQQTLSDPLRRPPLPASLQCGNQYTSTEVDKFTRKLQSESWSAGEYFTFLPCLDLTDDSVTIFRWTQGESAE